MSDSHKMLITTTGFFNSGSSAITHLLSEVEGVENSSGVYEMRLLFDPDCISDLEYYLVDNPHRQNTSFALQRFKKYIDFNSSKLRNHHYEELCKGNFKRISYEYLNNLSEFKYWGACHLDSYLKGDLFWITNRIYKRVLLVLLQKIKCASFFPVTLLKPQLQYAGTYNRATFLKATQIYVNKLLEYINKSDNEILMVDQLVPPTNLKRYLKYLPEEYTKKIFIVDRDPRDLYATSKMFLTSGTIPVDTPEHFCDWFKWTRGQSLAQDAPDCVMRIHFEDLIYDYESTRTRILKFCKLENRNCKQKSVFKPELSINNTQVWNRYPTLKMDIEIIESLLSEYCYDFERKKLKPDFKKGKMFDC